MQNILVLFWLFFTAILGHTAGMHHRERVLGKEERRATWTYALIMVLPLIAMAATRSNYFGDTYAYLLDYRSIPGDMSGKLDYIRAHPKDRGFYAMGALVNVFAGAHFRYFFLLIALVQGYHLAKLYRKFSEDYWFSIFVFVASTDYLSWMHNGIRQFFAVAITLAAAEPIIKKKYIKAAIIIAFASLFHQSALMMLPIMFIVQGRPWNWKTLLVIMGTAVIMSSSGLFADTLDSLLADTQYKNVVSDWRFGGDDGTNPLRVLVYSVPTILSLFCRRKIITEGGRVIRIACNMSIISTALYLVSMVTSGIFIGRLPIYCSLYANGILLPWEFKHFYGRSLRSVALVCYVLFYFFQLIFAWGLL
ncbi:MAG: EpsG family protein [Clostridiales bacterium]|nr:EpsG family protein [Clostridiales bacterium]